MSESADFLRNISIFGALSDDALEFLSDRLEFVSRRPGELFFEEGETGDAVYVLLEGRADVEKRGKGHRIVLATLEEKACFGEIALVAVSPRSASVRAATDCRAARLAHRALYELHGHDLEQFTLMQMNLGREIARRLAETSDLLFAHSLVEAERDGAVSGPLGRALK